MSHLIIDPTTEKGKVQIEAIGWAQLQMNTVLHNFFNGKYQLLKGLVLEFRFGLDLKLNDIIKVDVSHLGPVTKQDLERAIAEATEALHLEEKAEEGKLLDEKK